MRAAAPLAFALRSSEADHGRKLGPVDGVEPSIAGMDRHQELLSGVVRNNLGHLFSLDATLLVRVVPMRTREGAQPSDIEKSQLASVGLFFGLLAVRRPGSDQS